MAFVTMPGIEGKVYVPDSIEKNKKNPCPDCFSCQWCSDTRCDECLKECKNCKKKIIPAFLFPFLFLFCLFQTPAYPASDWPTFKGNLYFTGNNDEIVVKNNSLKWLFMAGNTVYHPVVSDGMVYFSDLDKTVYCLDEETGVLVWKLSMTDISSHFLSAAAVAGKIKFPVIVGNELFLSDATAIYCLDKKNGKILWARAGIQENDLKTAVLDSIYADPIISGNTIYYGTRKNFIAREIKEGHVQWSTSEINSYGGFPAFYDKYIFTQSRDMLKNTYMIYCLEALTGKTVWTSLIEPSFLIYPPVVYKEKIFIPSGKKLFILDLASGKKLAEKEMEDLITSSPSFTEDEIFFAVANRKIVSIDPQTYAVQKELDFGERSSPQFALVRDQIYTAYNYEKEVGGRKIIFGALKAFNMNGGNALWEFMPPFPGGVAQISADGGVLFLPSGNYIYAVGTYYEGRIAYGGDGYAPSADTNSSGGLSSIQPSSSTSSAISSSSISSVIATPVNLDEVKKGDTVIVPDIYFEFNEAYLTKPSLKTLNLIVNQLKKSPGIKIEIRGHTDNVGTRAYNQTLSERRARTVMDYLIKNGISPERLSSSGFGFDMPVADNKTESGRAQNRRTEFKILDK